MRRSFTFVAILTLSLTASAYSSGDVKIRSRQTTGGVSFENTTYVKGDRTRTETMGGMMVSISQCSPARDITLNTAARTYSISERLGVRTSASASKGTAGFDGEVRRGGTVSVTTTLKDTGERRLFFGYTARRIQTKVVYESSADACTVMNNRIETDGWYIDAEFATECGGAKGPGETPVMSAPGGCRDDFRTKTIGTAKKGFAVLETTSIISEVGAPTLTMTNEVVEISREELEPALFEIPQGYSLARDDGPPAGPPLAGMQTSPGASRSNVPAMAPAEAPAPKKANVTRIGIANVKVTAAGDGISSEDLAAAVRNSFAEYLRTPDIEVVMLESKLPVAAKAEAAGLECDAVLFVTATHKKGGGGGFGGMFGKVIAPAVGSVGIGQTGSVAGNIAGQAATYAIINAGSLAANVKAKDEITIAIELSGTDGRALISKQYKRKAKENGEDIISPLIEEAATVIVESPLSSAGR